MDGEDGAGSGTDGVDAAADDLDLIDDPLDPRHVGDGRLGHLLEEIRGELAAEDQLAFAALTGNAAQSRIGGPH